MAVTTKVEGLDKWTRQVGRIPAAAKMALSESQAKNAAEMVARMRAIAPRKKGNLAQSINWSRGLPPKVEATGAFTLKARDLTVRQDILDKNGMLVTVYAGDDVAYYARFVEFGTKAHASRYFKRSRGRWRPGVDTDRVKRGHAATRPYPFFYPIIRGYAPKVRSRTTAAANRALKKAVTG